MKGPGHRVGMRAANIARVKRVKRRMLREAVAENVEVIRGMPPRGLRPLDRRLRFFMQRVPLLLILITLGGSAYMLSTKAELVQPAIGKPVFEAGVLRPQNAGPTLETTSTSIERVTAAAFPLAVRRVVLDAGHGGTDPGATAPEIAEKEITLDIGQRLRRLLERAGFEVIVTRDADRTIALRDRARLANDSRSDIFVSIHVNALMTHVESRGIETYYLGATSDPSLTQLAAEENRVSGYSLADMRKLLDGVYADARRDESQRACGGRADNAFHDPQTNDPGLENWGVKRAPFLVLVATDMPADPRRGGLHFEREGGGDAAPPEYRQKIAARALPRHPHVRRRQ